MWAWIAVAAWAAEVSGVEAYVEVGAPREAASGGVLDGEAAWVRTAAGCVQARLTRERPALYAEVPACARADATCTWLQPLDTGWGYGMITCTRADGTGWTGASGGSFHSRPVLVELTDDRAVWRTAFTLRADVTAHRFYEQPCTPESLEALAEPRPAHVIDGHRRCDTSEGFALTEVGRWPGGLGIGVGIGRSTAPVDCREACPDNPDVAAVRAANTALDGRWFARPDAPAYGVFRTAAQCEATPTTPWTIEGCPPP